MADVSAAAVRAPIARFSIGAFGLAAVLGLVAMVVGDLFGAIEGRVLLTALLVGLAGVAVLCCLGTAGTPFQWVGVLGGVALLAPVSTGLEMIWHDFETEPDVWLARTFTLGLILAATLAQACLVLAPVPHPGRVVRGIRLGTLATAAVVAVMLSVMTLVDHEPGSLFLRVLVVTGVLDALGTLAMAALVRVGAAPAEPLPVVALAVPPVLADRLEAVAERAGRPADAVLVDALEGYLTLAEVSLTTADGP
jgi:hypothetical protein